MVAPSFATSVRHESPRPVAPVLVPTTAPEHARLPTPLAAPSGAGGGVEDKGSSSSAQANVASAGVARHESGPSERDRAAPLTIAAPATPRAALASSGRAAGGNASGSASVAAQEAEGGEAQDGNSARKRSTENRRLDGGSSNVALQSAAAPDMATGGAHPYTEQYSARASARDYSVYSAESSARDLGSRCSSRCSSTAGSRAGSRTGSPRSEHRRSKRPPHPAKRGCSRAVSGAPGQADSPVPKLRGGLRGESCRMPQAQVLPSVFPKFQMETELDSGAESDRPQLEITFTLELPTWESLWKRFLPPSTPGVAKVQQQQQQRQ
uniref:Uncharacterized protein n=1 Tax=Haptolina ericina TaxID=156174 RepID=A0A6T9GM34_9EUKA